MIFDNITLVRARKTDPKTSKAAAKKADRFASTHASRILVALKEGPRTAKGLSAMTGLTVVQIDRRLPELRKEKLAEPMFRDDEHELVIGGYRVWRAV
jgi:predicted HTH transcriptional regulator